MTPADLGTLRQRLTELADAVGSKAPGEAGIKAWLMALRDFQMPEVVDAMDQWVRTKTKMPAPADIRLILAGRLSDRIERKAVEDAAQFAAGGKRILSEASKRIARGHLDKIAALLHAFRRNDDPDAWWHALILRWRRGDELAWMQMVNVKAAWEHSGRSRMAPPGIDPEAEVERSAIKAEAEPL